MISVGVKFESHLLWRNSVRLCLRVDAVGFKSHFTWLLFLFPPNFTVRLIFGPNATIQFLFFFNPTLHCEELWEVCEAVSHPLEKWQHNHDGSPLVVLSLFLRSLSKTLFYNQDDKFLDITFATIEVRMPTRAALTPAHLKVTCYICVSMTMKVKGKASSAFSSGERERERGWSHQN